MTDLTECPGCGARHAPDAVLCPGCGACPTCGRPRWKKEFAHLSDGRHETCGACGAPYCDSCGRCPGCGEVRCADVSTACPVCNHPGDTSEYTGKPWWKRIL
jgi:hypothetical protein